jgi:thiosulfate/3-mercaptopyruvate sulfurtransferase
MLPLIILGLGVLAAEPPKKHEYPNGAILIEPGQLARLLESDVFRSLVVVLDCRGAKKDFAEGHVPHALGINPEVWMTRFGKNRAGEDWPDFLRLCGITKAARTLVIYDDSMGKDAARIWWILRYFGFSDVRLLNGGWRAWTAAKLPIAKPATTMERFGVPAVHGESLALKPQGDRYADKSSMLTNLQSHALDALVIDARSADEHCGKANTAKRNGAIPGSKHLEWSELLEKETHRFKSPEELKKLFDEAGIDLNKPLITYCQSGGRASVMAFALELMGAKKVRNYYAGWSEWGNADDTPIGPGKVKEKK